MSGKPILEIGWHTNAITHFLLTNKAREALRGNRKQYKSEVLKAGTLKDRSRVITDASLETDSNQNG